jgi:hypothetical protein
VTPELADGASPTRSTFGAVAGLLFDRIPVWVTCSLQSSDGLGAEELTDSCSFSLSLILICMALAATE